MKRDDYNVKELSINKIKKMFPGADVLSVADKKDELTFTLCKEGTSEPLIMPAIIVDKNTGDIFTYNPIQGRHRI